MNTYKVTRVIQSLQPDSKPTPVVYYSGSDKVQALSASVTAFADEDNDYYKVLSVAIEISEVES